MRNRSIPFGYYYQNGVLAVHPQEGQTVQAVFAAYLSGEPLSKIAAHLTAKLVEYLPGYWKWDKARVKRLLDNAKYIGNGEYPPIIKEKDFQMAHQKKESANTNRQPADEDIKLFKGLTYCHHCGAPMVRRMDSRMEHPCHLEVSSVRLLSSSARRGLQTAGVSPPEKTGGQAPAGRKRGR